jgi:hypothetical protein
MHIASIVICFLFFLEMGRRYYCDYCDKRIPPGLSHRKNHNKGIQHINNKRNYYLQFKGWNYIALICWRGKKYFI